MVHHFAEALTTTVCRLAVARRPDVVAMWHFFCFVSLGASAPIQR